MTVEEKKEIGKRIQRRRKELKLTQKELADLIHKVEGSVRQYENGLRMPDETTKIAIANALNVRYADLFILDQTPMSFDSPEDFKKAWEESTKKDRETPGIGKKTGHGPNGSVTNEVITHHLDTTDLSAVEREELQNYKD